RNGYAGNVVEADLRGKIVPNEPRRARRQRDRARGTNRRSWQILLGVEGCGDIRRDDRGGVAVRDRSGDAVPANEDVYIHRRGGRTSERDQVRGRHTTGRISHGLAVDVAETSSHLSHGRLIHTRDITSLTIEGEDVGLAQYLNGRIEGLAPDREFLTDEEETL